LPQPILTPSTKAPQGGHDEPIAADQLLARGLLTTAQWEQIAPLCLKLFAFGSQIAAASGLILVDTKYEWGISEEGRLLVVDEVHTPDSSRYWYRDGYEQALSRGEAPRALDKEFLRRHLSQLGYQGEGPVPPISDALRMEVARRYAEVFEQITGTPFIPNTEDPIPRMRRNLSLKVNSPRS
jgi:phosphoribosylaminoimidazole-succinocarboxamide synthase